MATNLQLDNNLIAKAVKLGRHLEQEKILSLFGTIDYDPKYNHKKQRSRT